MCTTRPRWRRSHLSPFIHAERCGARDFLVARGTGRQEISRSGAIATFQKKRVTKAADVAAKISAGGFLIEG